MPILMKINEEERGFKQLLRLFATHPVIDGIILGIVLSVIKGFVPVTGNRYYEAVHLLLTTVGSMTVPLMCIIIGYGLRIQFSTIALPLKMIFLRITVHTGLMYLINKLVFVRAFGLPAIYQYALLTMFALLPYFME